MSKANRIKGKYCPVLGARTSSMNRKLSIAQRTYGITERHNPTPTKRVKMKLTKTMRKSMKALAQQFKGKDPSHPVAMQSAKQNAGYGIIIGLINSVTQQPEQSAV